MDRLRDLQERSGRLEILYHSTVSQVSGEVLITNPEPAAGHPALTIPIGFVSARDNQSVKLPTALQIVGKKFADIDCLKVGVAYETAYDWRHATL